MSELDDFARQCAVDTQARIDDLESRLLAKEAECERLGNTAGSALLARLEAAEKACFEAERCGVEPNTVLGRSLKSWREKREKNK